MKTFFPWIRRRDAFSLTEVVLALGLVSFCLLAVVGLLPVGLKSISRAHEESAAANALNQISEALRNAVDDSGTYTAVGFPAINWQRGASVKTVTVPLSLGGQPTNLSGARMLAEIKLTPPPDRASPGCAQIAIFWPPEGSARDSIACGLQFLPKQ